MFDGEVDPEANEPVPEFVERVVYPQYVRYRRQWGPTVYPVEALGVSWGKPWRP
jgi:hypothetical protein